MGKYQRFGALIALSLAQSAVAQENPPPPSAAGSSDRQVVAAPPEVTPPKRAAGKSYIAKRYNLSDEEAERRTALGRVIDKGTTSLLTKYGDALIGAFIDHEPNYRITFVFSRDVAVADLQRLLPPEIRRYAAVKRSKYDNAAIERLTNQIVDALTEVGVAGSAGYDFRTDKIRVVTDEERGRRLMAALPVELRSEVRLVPGGIPSMIQTGARTGDTFSGGWHYFSAPGTGSPTCTYAFPVRMSDSKEAMLTAAHCSGSAAYRYGDGHTITFPTPPYDERYVYNTSSRGYDFKIIRAGTIRVNPYVYFWNNRTGTYWQNNLYSGWSEKNWANVNPNYPAEGYSQLVGVISGSGTSTSNYYYRAGDVRCLGGMTTGITCGQITVSSATAVQEMPDKSLRRFPGYVQVESQDYMVLAYGGDSGGPAVTEPIWNSSTGYYQVYAAGVITMGSYRDRGDGYQRPCVMPSDGSCPAYYMAIDRINDFRPASIITTNGTITP